MQRIVVIRKATVNDLNAILELNKKLFEYETAFNIEFNPEWSYSDSGQAYFKKVIEGDNGFALVAEVSGKVVGYVAVSIYNLSFRTKNPIAELDNVFIEEEFRRMGAGKKLIEKAKNLAREKGIKRIKVEAAVQNQKALAFYRSCGFKDFDLVLETDL